jgi:hypothetical protein
MSRASPQMREFARRLIAHEARETKSSGSKSPGELQVCEKLRPHLATLMGTGGFQALLGRALALAQGEAHWLRAAHVKPDGSLEGLNAPAAKLDAQALAEGEEILLAQLLSLLVIFIGASLTLQLLRQLWPKLPTNDIWIWAED